MWEETIQTQERRMDIAQSRCETGMGIREKPRRT